MPTHKQILWSPNLITIGLCYFSASGISEKVKRIQIDDEKFTASFVRQEQDVTHCYYKVYKFTLYTLLFI